MNIHLYPISTHSISTISFIHQLSNGRSHPPKESPSLDRPILIPTNKMDRERLENLRRENTDLLADESPLRDRIQARQQQVQVRQSQFHDREYRAHRDNDPLPSLNEKRLYDTIMDVLIEENQRDLLKLHNISQRRAEIRDELRTAGVPELDDDTVWFWLCLTGWSWFGLTVRLRSFWVTDLIVKFWSWFWGDQGPFSHWIVLYLCGLVRGFWGELLHYLELLWQLGAAF
ncbi:uncharacterized protein LDX57_008138 [Aspergillus melleus]|uniref:uncharacterized protein n=1 Tax=Aspergillus melleus TaxID=138277 RepID=UPI001E8E298A|nr:uncharacterized protein LDX57_008138 [Aspergillus melleus]KAH8430479.1 hypothetical protein LDX57_008138 [Aspergillus melleus]